MHVWRVYDGTNGRSNWQISIIVKSSTTINDLILKKYSKNYVSFVQTQGTMRYNLWWNMPFNQHSPISPFTQIKCKRNAMTRFRTYWILSPTPKQNRKETPLNPFVQTHYLYQVWIPKLCVHATCTNGTMQFILIYKRDDAIYFRPWCSCRSIAFNAWKLLKMLIQSVFYFFYFLLIFFSHNHLRTSIIIHINISFIFTYTLFALYIINIISHIWHVLIIKLSNISKM